MRAVFMGTAEFAVPSLEAMVESGHAVRSVWTQPDRPAGRGRSLRESHVKRAARRLGIEIHQPESLADDGVREVVESASPEILVVVAYGRIVPEWLRTAPRYGAVNVHGSLLPLFRGAAPVNWAIARGESVTGVSTMAIDDGLDTGPVYDREWTPIGENETAPELSERLSRIGASLLARTVAAIARGEARAVPQDGARATRAPRLRKEDGRIRWDAPARTIHNQVRAFLPWPSVVVSFRGTPCRILETRTTGESAGGAPGTILSGAGRLAVGCGDGRALEIVRLQLENRRAVRGVDFVHGKRLEAGERFGVFGES